MQSNFEANPFRPSALNEVGDKSNQASIDFEPILHRWEKYRLWYNGILIAYTLLLCVFWIPNLLLESLFWFQIVLLGGLCNLCFFVGPAIEAYGRYFRMWSSVLSLLLFLVGLLFTGLLDTAYVILRAFQ